MAEKKETNAVSTTMSARFTSMVVREFGSTVGTLALTPHQQRLAQHLFIGIDNSLRELDAKRIKDGRTNQAPIVWSNINMDKLALDAVHRIELGLDALIPGHIYPIPYFNGKTQKYDLDLRIGYVGKDYYRRAMAVDPPVDIVYQLVHEKDTFKPIMKGAGNDIESYEFEITNPFDRGDVIGGFGYIMYDNPAKNKLVIVSKADFDKSKKAAKSDMFWKPYEKEMQFKTLVTRVTSKLAVDPEKVSAAYTAVELDDNGREIQEMANQDFIDVEPEPPKKEARQPEKTQKKEAATQQPEPNGNGVTYLVCPASIDSKRPRKPISVCKACSNRVQCDAFAEWAMDNPGEAGTAQETGQMQESIGF
jgi:recombination protein RecT